MLQTPKCNFSLILLPPFGRKYPERFSDDIFRDSLPELEFRLEEVVNFDFKKVPFGGFLEDPNHVIEIAETQETSKNVGFQVSSSRKLRFTKKRWVSNSLNEVSDYHGLSHLMLVGICLEFFFYGSMS